MPSFRKANTPDPLTVDAWSWSVLLSQIRTGSSIVPRKKSDDPMNRCFPDGSKATDVAWKSNFLIEQASSPTRLAAASDWMRRSRSTAAARLN